MAKTKKEKVFEDELELPSEVSLVVEGDVIKLSARGKIFQTKFNNKVVKITQNQGKVVFKCLGKATRPKVACARSAKAHIKNMLAGAKQDFTKHLQVIYAHFPVSIEVKGKDVMIKNFLGEKLPRKAHIYGDVKVEVKGQDVFVKGHNRYAVGQTANNIVRATAIAQKDRRIFQDGIYLIEE